MFLLSVHSGEGVLLEGELLDVSRHAISDDNGQKVPSVTSDSGVCFREIWHQPVTSKYRAVFTDQYCIVYFKVLIELEVSSDLLNQGVAYAKSEWIFYDLPSLTLGPLLCAVHQTQSHPPEEVWRQRQGDRAKLQWHQEGHHWPPHVLLQWVDHTGHRSVAVCFFFIVSASCTCLCNYQLKYVLL